ncbi:uncharacterized protein LOC143850108 [Tasmannia lanceolata]|uniref:uncharacterized protein LOC143850108 n=1 Tax=Tasmannia lanceolata TaxID=3420 RepID=UPI004062E353
MAARKLRPYFQAHTIKVLTGQPLRQILHRPDTSGRLVKWAVELSEFDIKYLPRPAIKAQVLADFIAECTMPDSDPWSEAALPSEAEPVISEQQIEAEAVPLPGFESAAPPTSPLPCSEEPLWEVYVDGSSNKSGSGAGLVLTGPDDFVLNYALSGELPGEKKEARKVVQRAARFKLDGETLYKRSYTLPYLKCLRPTDALYALRETHEGICGEHLGGKALAIKVLLRSLYWPTLRQDALSLVKKCQKFSPAVHQPAVPMALIISPLPFAGIKKRLDDKAERWVDELYHVLWAYRTTPRTATGESPFNLSFETEAVIPVDIGIPSPRIVNFNEQLNVDGLRVNLDLLEEVREESRIRAAAYKQKT